MKSKLLIVFIFLFRIINAQVGINTSSPNENTLLHISEYSNEGSEILKKGIIIPRLSEEERDLLTFENPLANPKVIRLTASDNSLLIFNTTESCYNYWNYLEQEWKSLCGNEGNAKFNYDCSSAVVNGVYVVDKNLDESNYVLLKVNVTKKGSYIITLNPMNNSENGYSFVSMGTFNTLGEQTIKLFGQGKPITKTDNILNQFYINSSGQPDNEPSTCVSIKVEEEISDFSIDCSSVLVEGVYVKGVPLNETNVIKLYATIEKIGSYNVEVVLKNGIKFSSSGVFNNTGRNLITLRGSGTPTTNLDFDVELITNSNSGITSCNAIINMTLPAMKYALIGDLGVYSWQGAVRRDLLGNSSSFGPNGVVKVKSLTGRAYTVAEAVNSLLIDKPDVVLYFSYGQPVTTQLASVLNQYVNQGGVLVFGAQDGNFTSVNNLMSGIFGQEYSNSAQQQINYSSATSPYNSADDNVYPISNNPTDPIINGPFGNLAGRYWGEDNSSVGTIVVTNLPANSVQIASANNQWSKFSVDPSYSTVWYNNTKNFVYFGDSTGASTTSTSELEYPTIYKNGLPVSKRYGQFPNQATQAQFVVNSALELNVVAWALRKAASSGINPY